MAPSADFIERAFFPQIKKMGAIVSFKCVRHGFAPAGGGCILAEIHPIDKFQGSSVLDRGDLVSQHVECVIGNVREAVVNKEIDVVKEALDW